MTHETDINGRRHLAFGNDMSRIVRGIAVVLMVTGHSLPGKIIPFAVPLFSFLVGYGYYFAREKSLRHAAKRVWHLLSHFWLILFGICIPAAAISWTDSIKVSEVLLNMFGLCGRFNFYCWYIYFYMAAMCMMPAISRIIDRYGLKATLAISLLFGLACMAIYNWLGAYLTTGSPNVVSVAYRCFRYMPVVTMGYWLAASGFFSRIPIRKSLWSIPLCLAAIACIYALRGLPYMQWFDLIWAPLASALVAAIFNLYRLPVLRTVITELGLKSMGIWFLHALFFTHSTRDLFLPLISWIPLDNWMPEAGWLAHGVARIPVIVLISYIMAWIVDIIYSQLKVALTKAVARFPLAKATPVIAALILMGSCSSEKKADSYGSVLFNPEYASGFRITGEEGQSSVAVESINPWQGADNVKRSLFIARNNEAAPDGWEGQVLEGDARRIVTTSSTHVAFLDALGEASRIVGVSGKQFLNNPLIASRGDSVRDIGYDSNVDYETLLSLKPDLVMLYGVNGASPLEKRLREFGIPFIYIGDYTEDSPLAKSEWIVAIGELVGKGDFARQVFSQIPERYNAMCRLVKESSLQRPKVVLSIPQGDSWLMPSTSSYLARLINDAGGEYLYKRDTGNASRPVDLEEAYQLASKADMWIDTSIIRSIDQLKDACPKFADIPAVKSGNVYNNNLRENAAGGNDYYESGVVNPDIILQDLIRIMHPDLLPDHTLYYYHKLD